MSTSSRIAKNSIILYLRMFIVTIISLYTSRIILQTLGVNDYGIYNLAGGVISLFTVINTSLISSVQRFLNISLNDPCKNTFDKIFNASVNVHYVISFIFFLIGETVGLYIFFKLNIPSDREFAAMWVYQLSLLCALLKIIQTPYNAAIIAHEKMSFFAYLAIGEVILKLLIVFALLIIPFDSLIVYSILLLFVSVLMLISCFYYCTKKLQVPMYKYISIKDDSCKQLCKFSMWSFLGNSANICSNHGISLLLNVFFSVVVNSAIGITNQVTNTISSFIGNFQMAYKPSLVYNYINLNTEDFQLFICRIAKFSFFILWAAILPLFLNADFIIEIWLTEVPIYTVDFVKILLIFLLVDSISLPFYNAIEANGTIAKYQIYSSILTFLTIPIAYILLSRGSSPQLIIGLRVAINFGILLIRLFFSKKILRFKYGFLLRHLFIPIIFVVVFTFIPISELFSDYNGWLTLLKSTIVSCIFLLFSVYIFGLSKAEKHIIYQNVIKFTKK